MKKIQKTLLSLIICSLIIRCGTTAIISKRAGDNLAHADSASAARDLVLLGAGI